MPQYFISKKKINLGDSQPDLVINKLSEKYSFEKINTEDGLRIDFKDHWVHFRKSNTEPIIRIIVEADSELNSKKLIDQYFEEVNQALHN